MSKYPLEQVALIKQRRLEEAERVLKEKQAALQKELEILKEAEKKRDAVRALRAEKLRKFYEEAQEGLTSLHVKTHEQYLKRVVDEDLKIEEKNVFNQVQVVKKAQDAVEQARKDRFKKNQDVEKLHLHKHEWKQETLLEENKKEASEVDELGSNMHSLKKRRDAS